MTPEGKVKKACRAYLRRVGAYVFSPVQGGYGSATLDDLVCFKGHFIGIEYKAPGINAPSPRQEVIINQILAAGGTAAVINDESQIIELIAYINQRCMVPVRV